jgi:rRNA maturation endonuclease Nob1
VDETHSGTLSQLLCTPPAGADISVRALRQDLAGERLADPGYSCSLCGSSWPYRAVRNTGRCPTCGSGLLRDGDRL